MHPKISDFPSKQFYGGKILNGSNVTDISYIIPEVSPLRFINVNGEDEIDRGQQSLYNEFEAKCVLHVIEELIRKHIESIRISVITFYRAQVGYIKKILARKNLSSVIKVNTVDSFQGSEQDVSAVNTSRLAAAYILHFWII